MGEKALYPATGSLQYEIEANLCPEVVFLVYLSETYKIDLESLLLLYDRFREHLFFMLFLFGGKKILIPRHVKLTKFMSQAKKWTDALKRDDMDGLVVSDQEQKIVTLLKNIYDKDRGVLSFPSEVRMRSVESKVDNLHLECDLSEREPVNAEGIFAGPVVPSTGPCFEANTSNGRTIERLRRYRSGKTEGDGLGGFFETVPVSVSDPSNHLVSV
jgi:hypothetical protein